jgi:hypothetical protein
MLGPPSFQFDVARYSKKIDIMIPLVILIWVCRKKEGKQVERGTANCGMRVLKFEIAEQKTNKKYSYYLQQTDMQFT